MAKAGLPEPESPADAKPHPPEAAPETGAAPCDGLVGRPTHLRGAERCPVRALKGTNRAPTSRSIRTTRTNAGSPTGREPRGDGAAVVVAGVATGRGGRESRPHGRRAAGDRTPGNREVCEMQSAETVLGVLRERGRRCLPCNELYRQLFNPQLFLLAYGRIYANKGAMTPGVTEETVDGRRIPAIVATLSRFMIAYRPRILQPGFAIPSICAVGCSSVPRRRGVRRRCAGRGRCPSGSTGAAVRSCSRWCRAAMDWPAWRSRRPRRRTGRSGRAWPSRSPGPRSGCAGSPWQVGEAGDESVA